LAVSPLTDRMALSLRGNAVSMAKLQLAMASLAGSEAPSPEPAPVPDRAAPNHAAPEYAAPVPASAEPPRLAPPPCRAEPADHALCSDALSLFVSHRLAPGESAYEAWEWALAAS
jgi:hypothetical protein